MPKDPKPARSASGEREAIGDLLRKAGVRATHQRIEVMRVLAIADDHPAAEEIRRRLRATMPTSACITTSAAKCATAFRTSTGLTSTR